MSMKILASHRPGQKQSSTKAAETLMNPPGIEKSMFLSFPRNRESRPSEFLCPPTLVRLETFTEAPACGLLANALDLAVLKIPKSEVDIEFLMSLSISFRKTG